MRSGRLLRGGDKPRELLWQWLQRAGHSTRAPKNMSGRGVAAPPFRGCGWILALVLVVVILWIVCHMGPGAAAAAAAAAAARICPVVRTSGGRCWRLRALHRGLLCGGVLGLAWRVLLAGCRLLDTAAARVRGLGSRPLGRGARCLSSVVATGEQQRVCLADVVQVADTGANQRTRPDACRGQCLAVMPLQAARGALSPSGSGAGCLLVQEPDGAGVIWSCAGPPTSRYVHGCVHGSLTCSSSAADAANSGPSNPCAVVSAAAKLGSVQLCLLALGGWGAGGLQASVASLSCPSARSCVPANGMSNCAGARIALYGMLQCSAGASSAADAMSCGHCARWLPSRLASREGPDRARAYEDDSARREVCDAAVWYKRGGSRGQLFLKDPVYYKANQHGLLCCPYIKLETPGNATQDQTARKTVTNLVMCCVMSNLNSANSCLNTETHWQLAMFIGTSVRRAFCVAAHGAACYRPSRRPVPQAIGTLAH
jgi:hypothetical protein